MAKRLTAEERRWQAESDAHTLGQAEAIKADPVRMRAAAEKAAELAQDQATQAKALQKVARKATPQRSSRRSKK